jgi:hypothetical protein
MRNIPPRKSLATPDPPSGTPPREKSVRPIDYDFHFQ